MTLLVTIRGWEVEPWLDRFRRLLPDKRIVTPGDDFARDRVEYVATWKHPAGALRDLPKLKAIFSLGAGVDHVFADPDLPDVPVARVVDPDLTMRMSEWVLLHVLMHHRQQRMYDWQQVEKIWAEDREQPAAKDVRVGVMGLGELGADAARKLAVVGFDVAGWARSRHRLEGIRSFAGAAELDAFLARTDILVCLLPLTPDTRDILDRALFGKLARDGRLGGPIVINGGRGGLQNEDDIIAALDDATLKAAVLDVFKSEPLPPDSPLWSHPRVTVSPHNSAVSNPDAIAAMIARQIRAFERGEALRNVVDRTRQY
ncbi:MAG: glyoxylate/hydroxypyruvate reductase A [Methylobacteriaceae bacterium]|nr:glyoxylate/hydroxypyruvate reductase A [Methylobacteriaceae bacterium]